LAAGFHVFVPLVEQVGVRGEEAEGGLLLEIFFEALLANLLALGEEPVAEVGVAVAALIHERVDVAVDLGHDTEARKCNGASQLASLLIGKNVIHVNHQKLADMVAAVRNAKTHHKDKRTLTPWHITPLGAFAAVSTTLTAIRSVFEYVKGGKQDI